MRRQQARRLARLCMATGLPPSELRSLTGWELAAFVELLAEDDD